MVRTEFAIAAGGTTMTWRAHLGTPARMLIWATFALALACVALAAAIFVIPLTALSLGLAVLSLLALLSAALCGTLFLCAISMRYTLRDDTLEITWLSHRVAIPYASIDGVFSGGRLGPVHGTTLISGAGCRIGEVRDPSGKPVYFFTTTRDEEALSMISTDTGAVVISPTSSPAFRRELIARLEAAEEDQSAAVLSIPAWPLLPLRDPVLLGTFGISLVILLAVLGVLFDRFGSLATEVAVQFDSFRRPSGLVPKTQLFALPGVGGASLFVNSAIGYRLYAAEPVLARLLWLMSPLVQALVLISLIRVIR